MRALRRYPVRVVNFATRRRNDERLREEMQAHLAMQTDENLRAGMTPVEARRQAYSWLTPTPSHWLRRAFRKSVR